MRVVVTEQQLGRSSEPALRDLSEVLITVYGTDFGSTVPYPAGGQGLSLGVQDGGIWETKKARSSSCFAAVWSSRCHVTGSIVIARGCQLMRTLIAGQPAMWSVFGRHPIAASHANHDSVRFVTVAR